MATSTLISDVIGFVQWKPIFVFVQWKVGREISKPHTSGPFKEFVPVCIDGKNNDINFIFGGSSPLGINQSFVNQFDTNKQQWINITSIGSSVNQFDSSKQQWINITFIGSVLANRYGIHVLILTMD